MTGLLIGYARCSTDGQDLTAQRNALTDLGVEASRIYVDHGLTGTNRDRPGLREAMAACRDGDTLVVTKLDRLARSLPDARAILEELTTRQIRLSLGGSLHDPTDPVGRLLFNVLAMVAESSAPGCPSPGSSAASIEQTNHGLSPPSPSLAAVDLSTPPDRPLPDTRLAAAELLRWYWTLDELRQLARLREVRTTGSKTVLTQRLHADMCGLPFAEPPTRRAVAAPLPEALHHGTIIPVGQRCSQQLRTWFTDQVGPGFRFDAAMRAFISEGDGTATLADALLHWHQTRGKVNEVIDEQFEYNRFTRRWRAEHDDGSRQELLNAWRTYRNRPAEERGRA